jgi:hypothetical protein
MHLVLLATEKNLAFEAMIVRRNVDKKMMITPVFINRLILAWGY